MLRCFKLLQEVELKAQLTKDIGAQIVQTLGCVGVYEGSSKVLSRVGLQPNVCQGEPNADLHKTVLDLETLDEWGSTWPCNRPSPSLWLLRGHRAQLQQHVDCRLCVVLGTRNDDHLESFFDKSALIQSLRYSTATASEIDSRASRATLSLKTFQKDPVHC